MSDGVIKMLRSQKVRLGNLDPGQTRRYDLDEDVARKGWGQIVIKN